MVNEPSARITQNDQRPPPSIEGMNESADVEFYSLVRNRYRILTIGGLQQYRNDPEFKI
jgi:hypothetical protein